MGRELKVGEKEGLRLSFTRQIKTVLGDREREKKNCDSFNTTLSALHTVNP